MGSGVFRKSAIGYSLRPACLASGMPLALGFALGGGVLAVAQVAAGAAVVLLAGVGDVHGATSRLLRLGLHRPLVGWSGVVSFCHPSLCRCKAARDSGYRSCQLTFWLIQWG